MEAELTLPLCRDPARSSNPVPVAGPALFPAGHAGGPPFPGGLPRSARMEAVVRAGWRRATAWAVVVGGLGLSACTYETSESAEQLPEVAQTSRILAADGTLLHTFGASRTATWSI